MAKITFVEHNGSLHAVDADENLSPMALATSKLIPGIHADCGGTCACGICHMHIDEPRLSKLEAMSDGERQMPEVVTLYDASSRLSCQIKMHAQLAGMVVRTPAGQQ